MQEQEKHSVAVVTGSSSGIGFETSLLLARSGFYTYATMRNINRSEPLLDIAKKDTLPLKVIPLDVNNDNSGKEAIGRIMQKFERIDVVVNNAGYGLIGALEDIPVEEIKSHFETNLFGAIRIIQAVLDLYLLCYNLNATIKLRITFPSNSTSKEIVSHNGQATYNAELNQNSKNNNYNATAEASAPGYISTTNTTTSSSTSITTSNSKSV
jgi:NAD(P)-dependent dehydrogenase (short-subunit alcohol dehydrogenase family)